MRIEVCLFSFAVLVGALLVVSQLTEGVARTAIAGATATPLVTATPTPSPTPSPTPEPSPIERQFSVNTTADTNDAQPGDHICAGANGFCSVRAAVQETNGFPGSDHIDIPAGSYGLTPPCCSGKSIGISETAGSGALVIYDDLTITGAGAGTTIVRRDTDDPNDGFAQVFVIDRDSSLYVTISDLTASEGAFFFDGGGIWNGGNLTLDRVVVTKSSTGEGGGAIYSARGSTLTIRNSLLFDNSAYYGTAIWNAGSARLENVTVSGNLGPLGRTAVVSIGHIDIVSSTIVESNPPPNQPLPSSSPTSAAILGHPTFSPHPTETPVPNTRFGSIAIKPQAGVTCTWVIDAFHNIDAEGDCIGALSGLVKPLADNGGQTETHALVPGNPALDVWSGSECPATDQRGVARPQGSGCDAGAFELRSAGMQGDLNCDGDIDTLDALLAFTHRAVSGCLDVGGGDPPFGDVNCDGVVDELDALLILAYTAGVPFPDPPCPPIGQVMPN